MEDNLELVLDGSPEDVRRQTTEALLFYSSPSRGIKDDLAKAARLRNAFDSIRDWLSARRLPNLNEAQWLFLSTGALCSTARVARGGEMVEVELIPESVLEFLAKARAGKPGRPEWAASVLDGEDKLTAIARGELVGMEGGTARRRRPAKPLGSGGLKAAAQARLEILLARARELVALVEGSLGVFSRMGEGNLKGARLNVEALKKYSLLAGAGEKKTEPEARIMTSIGRVAGGYRAFDFRRGRTA